MAMCASPVPVLFRKCVARIRGEDRQDTGIRDPIATLLSLCANVENPPSANSGLTRAHHHPGLRTQPQKAGDAHWRC